MTNYNNIGFVQKNGYNIDKIMRNGKKLFEQGFIREDSGSTPLTTSHEAIGKDLKGYKVYGNSIQDGTPTPSNPVEIESVGDKTVNLFNPQSNWNINGSIGRTTKKFPYTEGGIKYTYFFRCKPNTQYTISFKEPGDRLIICGLYTEVDPTIYTESNQLTFDHYIENLASDIPTSLTFTTDVNDKMIGIYYVLSQSPTEMQIEENSQATSYEPYYEGYKIPITVSDGTNSTTTNIYLSEPLRKIGNYADYIDFENGKVVRNIGNIELKGTEAWYIYYNTYIKSDACDAFLNNIGNNSASQSYSRSVGFCNIAYNAKRAIWVYTGYPNTFVFNNKQFHLNIANDVLGITDYTQETMVTALEKFKSFIANQYANGMPVIIYYPLYVQTEETIILPTIPSIKGTTIYSVGTNITPSNMYIKYKGR